LLSGHLRIAYVPQQVEQMEKHAQDTQPYGLDLEMLSAQAVRARFPFLGPEIVAGCYAPHDGHANPRLAAPAFGRAAVREGAQVFENTEIVNVEKVGEDFRVTAADGRTFRAPVALITAGAWGNRISTTFGEPVPMQAKGPQMAVTEPVPYGIAPVMGVATDKEKEVIYFRQVERGNIVIGGCGREAVDLDARRSFVNPRHTLHQFTELQRIVPALKRLSLIRVWSGIEGYMQDERPVMGPSVRVPGLYYAFGFSGEGFQMGPGVGDVMAELIHTGATSTPISQYSIRRFAELSTHEDLS
jgi:sarcosine oxidase subunit beta